jgi:energy-coupling factor transporter ATP-binding protein EcfA2
MKRNIWDEQAGMPSRAYLVFVARFFLQEEAEQPLIDPFALDIAVDKIKDVYVPREDVENVIGQPGTLVIVGAEGSGKTTLLRTLSTSQRKQTLVVHLPLSQIAMSIPGQEWAEGKVSLLTPPLLVRYIFNAYWEDLLRRPDNRAKFLPKLRYDERWIAKLQWFYQHYRPVDAEIATEAELTNQLNASTSSLSVKRAPGSMLQELVFLVMSAAPREERIDDFHSQPYTQIQVFIDGTEYLSEQAIRRLIRDMQRFRHMHPANLQLKLFTDLCWQGQLRSMEDVAQHRVTMYCLPRWNEKELRQVLNFRLTALKSGEFAGYGWGDLTGLDWTDLIPDTHMRPAAKKGLVDTIVQTAAKTYEEGGRLDAPVHALKLARGLVAACAGCWKRQGYEPPLSYGQIRELADFYWRAKANIPVIRTRLEQKALEQKKATGWSLPPEQLPKVKAIVHVRDHEPDCPFYIGEEFVLETGAQRDLSESCEGVETSGLEEDFHFKIVVYAEGMEISPTRMRPYVFRQSEYSPLIEFRLRPLQLGCKRIRVEFLYQQHWLTKIEFDLHVVQATEPISSDRSENHR